MTAGAAPAAAAAPSTAAAVLDFDPRETNPEVVARTRGLLGRVLSSQGPEGLAKALHVPAPRAAQLKHRVACITCRSRLDTLATWLATASNAAACSGKPAASSGAAAAPGSEEPEPLPPPPEGPVPLTAWLSADAGHGLEFAPRALQDLDALAAFLAAFGCGGSQAGIVGAEDVVEDTAIKRGGRSGGVVRCALHATRTLGKTGASSSASSTAAATPAASLSIGGASTTVAPRDRERYIAVLRAGTSSSEWRQLGTIDVDSAMCDLFAWLGDRGLCSSCVDFVTGALLEVRRAVTSTCCSCPHCKCACAARELPEGAPAETPRPPNEISSVPEFVRVQGRLKAICGVYRLEPLPFNGRPVYKKHSSEAYLLYTRLKDWMLSGRADAGGSRCEGWAYVTDPAETPDEVCGVWKVSGPRGWEEDRSLSVRIFQGLPEELRAGLGYDDGSAIAKRLCADDRGVLVVPLQEQEVLNEVLWEPDEPLPGKACSGSGCTNIRTPEAVQRELQCWLRWLLRDRLDAQRRRVLAQAQVGASLCRLFACAALQQLDQVADAPLPAPKRAKAKKGRESAKAAAAPLELASVMESPKPPASPAAAASTAAHVDADPHTPARGAPRAGEATPDVASPSGRGHEADARSDCASSQPASPPSKPLATTACGCSDETASTRASSEEPPDEDARRLMEQMGWRPEETGEAALRGSEVAQWLLLNPRYRQAVREGRQKLRVQFDMWAQAAEAAADA